MRLPNQNLGIVRYRKNVHISVALLTQRDAVEPQGWISRLISRAPLVWLAKKSFYAGCYYACVADTGDWQECGDRCPGGGLL